MSKNFKLATLRDLPRTLVVLARPHSEPNQGRWATPLTLTVTLAKRSFNEQHPDVIHRQERRGEVLFEIEINKALPEFCNAITHRDARIAELELRLSEDSRRRLELDRRNGDAP